MYTFNMFKVNKVLKSLIDKVEGLVCVYHTTKRYEEIIWFGIMAASTKKPFFVLSVY